MSQSKGHIRQNNSFPAVRDGGVAKRNGQKAACDRCRGQKLRCIWHVEQSQCRRCHRANTTCAVPFSRPMGRPQMQHRNTGSYNHDRDGAMYSWSDKTPTSAAPDGKDTVGPLEFINYFSDPGCLNEPLPPDGPVAPVPIMPDPRESLKSHVTIDNRRRRQVETNRKELDRDNHLLVEKADDDHVQLLTQLGYLNVALFQHPLNHEDKARPRTMFAPGSPSHTPAGGQCNEYLPSPDLSISNLGIGKLLKMTSQLNGIVTRIRYLADGTPRKAADHDKSTALLALSCYTRLDNLYSRTIEVLLKIRQGGQQLKDIHQLMPELAIDGFPMSQCYDLQLDLLIFLYK